MFAIAALILAIGASAGLIGQAAGFEGDDGNLAPGDVLVQGQASPNFDWNSFSPTTWAGTPLTSTKTVSGWKFTGIADAEGTTSDSAFAGGTKQDDNCSNVGTGKAPNKDDLKRIYIASNTVNGNTYLALAWARIPQNTTSSSAHVAFEFNQSKDPCPGSGHDGLVPRSVANGGDMLIVYDFEGGSSPVILKLLRWKDSSTDLAGDLCEASGKAVPAAPSGCWVFDETLTGTGNGEARVNTADATDNIAPSPPDTLHSQEFGEAIINLTGAGVFPATPTSCLSFGRTFGVSRSSGNSAQAQMKDLVGPADINIGNCATVIVRKVTSPSGDTTTSFGYTTNVTTLPATTTSPFSLKDGEANTISNVVPSTTANSRNVTENDPGPGYALDSIDCSASTVPAANRSTSVANRQVLFSIAAGQTLDCTFTNAKQKAESSMDTDPWIYPNDTATVDAASGETDIDGTVEFKLYGATDGGTPATAAENCDANGSQGLLYSETVTLPDAADDSKEASTSNPGTTGSPTSLAIDADAVVYWRVEYSGDANHFGRLSDCVENINVDFTGDTGGDNVPDN
jgi:hypothetical protein